MVITDHNEPFKKKKKENRNVLKRVDLKRIMNSWRTWLWHMLENWRKTTGELESRGTMNNCTYGLKSQEPQIGQCQLEAIVNSLWLKLYGTREWLQNLPSAKLRGRSSLIERVFVCCQLFNRWFVLAAFTFVLVTKNIIAPCVWVFLRFSLFVPNCWRTFWLELILN